MTWNYSVSGNWTELLYNIECMQQTLLSLISMRSTKWYYGKYVLPWFCLTFFFRATIPFVANELFYRHYQEPIAVIVMHWINAAVIATIVMWTMYVHHVAQEGRYLVDLCVSAFQKKNVQLDVVQMKERIQTRLMSVGGTFLILTFMFGICITVWCFAYLCIMADYKCTGHLFAQLFIFFFCIPMWYEVKFFDDNINMKQLNALEFKQEGWTDEQKHAYFMSQIRIRARIVRSINERRLRNVAFDRESAIYCLCHIAYLPMTRQVRIATTYLHDKNIMLETTEGEYDETDRAINDVLRARSDSWWELARFELDGAPPGLMDKLCAAHTVHMEE